MFGIKKTTKVSVCWAMRCTNLAADKLCDKHHAEWMAAGQPPLEYTAPAASAPVAGTAIVLDEAKQAELTSERHRLQEALALAQTFPLRVEGDTPEMARARRERATEIMNGAHERAKQFKAELAKILDPLKEATKVAKGWIQPNIDTLEAIKSTLARRLGEAQLELVAERDQALQVIQESAGNAPALAFAAAHADVTAPAPMTEVITYEVTDTSALPDWAWMRVVNHPEIKRRVEAGEEVAGVTVSRTMKARIG